MPFLPWKGERTELKTLLGHLLWLLLLAPLFLMVSYFVKGVQRWFACVFALHAMEKWRMSRFSSQPCQTSVWWATWRLQAWIQWLFKAVKYLLQSTAWKIEGLEGHRIPNIMFGKHSGTGTRQASFLLSLCFVLSSWELEWQFLHMKKPERHGASGAARLLTGEGVSSLLLSSIMHNLSFSRDSFWILREATIGAFINIWFYSKFCFQNYFQDTIKNLFLYLAREVIFELILPSKQSFSPCRRSVICADSPAQTAWAGTHEKSGQ